MTLAVQDKHALVLLVKQIFDQIDEIASLKKQGLKASISQELLKEMCSILPELTAEQKDYYNELVVKLSQSAEPAKAVYNKDYAQFSANSKRNLLFKIRTDLKIAGNG